MTRKIFGLLLCIVIANGVFAQDSLLRNRVVNARIQTGYFMQKVGSTINDNDTIINRLQAKNSLWLDTSALPLVNYMPPNSKLVPLSTVPCTGTSLLLCATQNADYTSCGTYIYSQGFNNTLTTYTRTKIAATNTFWIGTTANCGVTPPTTASVSTTTLAKTASTSETTDSSAIYSAAIAASLNTTTASSTRTASVAAVAAVTALTGPLNRAGMWANCSGSGPMSQWIGIQRTITANATQTIYLGVGARSSFKIMIDALTVVTYGGAGNVYPYKIWHIFPIQMGPGIHILSIQANNANEVGVLGVELYNNTSAEITAATGYEGLKLLFSTKDMAGKYICQ
jgi:hypothetical protein